MLADQQKVNRDEYIMLPIQLVRPVLISEQSGTQFKNAHPPTALRSQAGVNDSASVLRNSHSSPEETVNISLTSTVFRMESIKALVMRVLESSTWVLCICELMNINYRDQQVSE